MDEPACANGKQRVGNQCRVFERRPDARSESYTIRIDRRGTFQRTGQYRFFLQKSEHFTGHEGSVIGKATVGNPHPFGMGAGHDDNRIMRAPVHKSKKLRLLATHNIGCRFVPTRDARQHDDVTARGHAHRSLHDAIQPGGQAHIGRFDPAGPRTGHAADHHRQIVRRADRSKVPLERWLETGFLCLQQTVIATAFAQHIAIDIQRPEAEPGGAPVRNCRKWHFIESHPGNPSGCLAAGHAYARCPDT